MTNLYACDCVRFHMHVMCVLVCMGISRQNSFQGGENVGKILIFLKNGKNNKIGIMVQGSL